MHHALEIDEILMNIFDHCNPPRFKNYKHGRPVGVAADLVALARTCRMFKEPALDVLWSELSDLCPLAKSLPQVSSQLIPGFRVRNLYSLLRVEFPYHLTMVQSGVHSKGHSNKPSGIPLFSGSLAPISKLLAHTQLPAITDFIFEIGSCPSKQNVTSFFALQLSGIGDSITKLRLTQIHHSLAIARLDPLDFTINNLRPSMVLRNFRRIDLNLGWNVTLTDSEAPLGTSLHQRGLVRLLQTCRSLRRLSLATDTRGYTEIPPLQSPASLGLNLPSFSINVVDPVIDTASVPPMAAFLVNIVPSARFSLSAWSGSLLLWCIVRHLPTSFFQI
ncbi:hypothetical protein OG21DRAFT_359777 [Imleria badia]|nr:hypothetical protein OG21DRAFT_359777 [Imleria badia]